MWDILKSGIILMLYCLAAGALLAFVHIKTAPVIEAQKEAAAVESVIEVLPGMDGGFDKKVTEDGFIYWVGYRDKGKKTPGGYTFIARQKGYSSTIESMVGVDADFTITGVKVLFQQETAGLGDRILEIRDGESEPWFTRQFIGKTLSDDIKVSKDGGTIDAISGATVSSRAVSLSIDNGRKMMKAALTGETFVPEEMPEEEEVIFTMPSDEAAAVVLPGMAGGYELHDEDSDFPYWTAYSDGNKTTIGGYIFIAQEEGFDSTIYTLVGVDTDGKIAGIKIYLHNETPEYGGKMEEILEGENRPWFTSQFLGKSASDTIALVEDDGDIDAVSEATISSRALTKSIDTGLKRLKAVLSGETYIPEEEPEEDEDDEIVFVDFTAVTAAEALEIVLPDMAGGYKLNGEDSDFPYWTAYMDTAKIEIGGYLFVASGEGYASTIETMIGVDTEGKIIGIKIISQEETEEWGDGIAGIRMGEDDPWFTRQFLGKSASDNIALVEDDGDIDAVTEATVSSRAVTEPVNDGLKKLMEIIQ